MTAVAAIVFWLSAGLLLYTHLGYPVVLWVLVYLRGSSAGAPRRTAAEVPPGPGTSPAPAQPPAPGVASPPGSAEPAAPSTAAQGAKAGSPPTVSLIVPAYDEQDVIAAKVANALDLDYPRDRLQVVVASDGSADATAERAREAGADLVLELPAGGKVAALNAAAEQASGEVLAFSDANATWHPDALRRLVAPLSDPAVGYACGQVRFTDPDGGNLEGAYWRYEMAVRELESDLAGVTGGNGAIYAVRRDAYLPLAASGSHELSFPFLLAKRGRRSLYVPEARAEEKMVPSLEGEFARKRRMMVGLWDIVVGEGMLSPRGYPPLYAFELVSHRLLRYLSPLLHLLALLANALLLGEGWFYTLAFLAQVALPAAALLGRFWPLLPFRVARYYVMTTASIAAGLWDRFRRRRATVGRWEKAEGTR